jgi:aminopeptidase N
MRLRSLVAGLLLACPAGAGAQSTPPYTHADSLRGSLTSPARTWWDVAFYDLHVAIDPSDSSIRGFNAITYRVRQAGGEMQIDLQAPLRVDSVVQDGRRLAWRRDGAAYFVTPGGPQAVGATRAITVYYHGRPPTARRPPWSGGFTWTADSLGHAWIVTTAQGIGASVWWPNKDTQADEPDSQRIAITLPDSMFDVSNGRLRRVTPNGDGTTTYEWFVADPINNYDVAVAASSDYAHFGELYHGEAGILTLDFWPLAYHLDAARRQFAQAASMLRCYEHWFGPYPWYADGYKLVEVPNTGMEHQSAIGYGNLYANGYRGRDWSHTGLGMQWDFIIVHESAHEWFGNSLTSQDLADMWVHESFANYAEGLYTECLLGKDSGAAYIIGNRNWIRNDRPIVPAYGVNAQGSEDMYPKGGNLLHTIRQIVGDDAKWRGILRGLTRTFRHQVVTGRQVEDYISREAGVDLSKVFDEYLRTTMVPVLEYRIAGDTLRYRWTEVVPGFAMPVGVTLTDSGYTVIHPTAIWRTAPLRLSDPGAFRVDPDYYVVPRAVLPDGGAAGGRAR